jgi:hypothetical protein
MNNNKFEQCDTCTDAGKSCETCEDASNYMKEEDHGKSLVPAETLERFIEHMKGVSNELTVGELPDSVGACNDVDEFISFLENIRQLYNECESCHRLIAPDEMYECRNNNECYCMECKEWI